MKLRKCTVRQFRVSGARRGVTSVAAQPVPLIPAPTHTTAHTGRVLRFACPATKDIITAKNMKGLMETEYLFPATV